MKLTKQQLKDLQSHRGQMDTDSGKVFVKAIGKPCSPDDAREWEVEAILADAKEGQEYGRFSLGAIGKPAVKVETPAIDTESQAPAKRSKS